MDKGGIQQGYNDIYFRIIIALLAAHIIVAFGVSDSLFQLLIYWPYYRSLSLSFVIAFLLVNEVYLVTVKLDKQYDWRHHTVPRIGLQLLFSLIIPSITAFILAAIYFKIFGINILNTYYLQFDFPVIVIMLLLLNVYYLAFYFYKQWRLTEDKILNSSGDTLKSKEVFIVQKGAKNIPLAVETICYFYHDGKYNFVRTSEREDFIITQPLDEVQQQLDDKKFFRVNRQMLVNFNACQHFEPLDFGKLELFVIPAAKDPVIISQKKSKAFKEWIGR